MIELLFMFKLVAAFSISGIIVFAWVKWGASKNIIAHSLQLASRVVCTVKTSHGEFATFDEGATWYRLHYGVHTKVVTYGLNAALTELYEDQLARALQPEVDQDG